MSPYRPLVTLIFCGAALCGQPSYTRHSISIGTGAAVPLEMESRAYGPTLDAAYTLRLSRIIGADLGYSAARDLGEYNWKGVISSERTWSQFGHYGLRLFLPLRSERWQFSAGAGGGVVSSRSAYWGYGYWTPRETTKLMQYSAQASYALDRAGHWRIGPTARYYRNLGQFRQEWFHTSLGISYNR
jgi:hypothetical protein